MIKAHINAYFYPKQYMVSLLVTFMHMSKDPSQHMCKCNTEICFLIHDHKVIHTFLAY